MRIANVAGRAVMAHGEEPIDVFEASGGRFGPSPSAVFDRWAEFRAWADVEYGPVPVVRDPAWLADEHNGAPSPHPRQVFAIGLNYAEHARESGYGLPTTPWCSPSSRRASWDHSTSFPCRTATWTGRSNWSP